MYDIIVIGAGLVGSITAIALDKIGLKVCLIDKRDINKKFNDHRTTAISAEVKNYLDYLGIFQSISEEAGEIRHIRITDSDSKLYLDFNNELVGNIPLGYMIENNILISHLHDIIKTSKITYISSTVLNAEYDSYNAKVTLEDKVISAPIAIAADGRFSKIREYLNIGYEQKNYNHTSIVFILEHEKDHNCIAHEKFYNSGPFAILPMKNKYQSGIVWTEPTETAEALLKLEQEEFLAFLHLKFGDFLGSFKIVSQISSYPLSLIYSHEYHKGRFAFVGDALHAIHPIAGQGLNLSIMGIKKLMSLIEKNYELGLDIGSDSMLRKYKKLTYIDDKQMIMITDTVNKIFGIKFLPFAISRKLGLKLLDNLSIIKQLIMNYAMGKRNDKWT